MKEFLVIVRVDLVSKDGNMIINKACDGVEKSFFKYYGVKVRAQRSMSRIYKRDVHHMCNVRQYASNNLFYGEGIIDSKNHTLVKVLLSMTDREVNHWKLKNMEGYLETMKKYNTGVFCNVGS